MVSQNNSGKYRACSQKEWAFCFSALGYVHCAGQYAGRGTPEQLKDEGDENSEKHKEVNELERCFPAHKFLYKSFVNSIHSN